MEDVAVALLSYPERKACNQPQENKISKLTTFVFVGGSINKIRNDLLVNKFHGKYKK